MTPPVPCLGLFTGEGAHSTQTDVAASVRSSLSCAVEAAVRRHTSHKLELAAYVTSHLGDHAAPHSPLVTTILNILNVGLWWAAGHEPQIVIGHSIGEVAAAYAAGWLTIDAAIDTAHGLGLAGMACAGAMMHAQLTRSEVDGWSDQELCIAAVNGVAINRDSTAGDATTGRRRDVLGVTLCGSAEVVERWLARWPGSKRLPPPHPWHHADYLEVPGVKDGSAFVRLPEAIPPATCKATFLSATSTVQHVERLDAAHWRNWLGSTVDFMGALERAAALLSGGCYVIEMGAHPVLSRAAAETLRACGVHVVVSVASMRRGQAESFWEAECGRLDAALCNAHSGPIVSRRRDDVESTMTQLRELLHTRWGIGDTGVDVPLMQTGLDSFDVPDLVEWLCRAFEVQLPPTILFECSTIRALSERIGGADCCPAPRGPRRQQMQEGLALRCSIDSLHTQSMNSLRVVGGDSIVQVPALRWAPPEAAPVATLYGGYVPRAELFDNVAFGISRAEAHAMDPQQRLLLESGYAATHGARLYRSELDGREMGIYVGLMSTDFAGIIGDNSVYAATGTQVSIASGRLAFVLGTQGPCESVDTACSAALVALNSALLCFQAKACDLAVASAVNLILLPRVSLLFAAAGMLSADGRCKAFDSRANGYVRGEGVRTVALDDAADAIAAVVSGCVVRADGRSASLTAPNGMAQARLVGAVLTAASLSSLHLVETHGTGTALGDPTEAGGLERVLGAAKTLLTGGKANLGHTEPAAVGAAELNLQLPTTPGFCMNRISILRSRAPPRTGARGADSSVSAIQ